MINTGMDGTIALVLIKAVQIMYESDAKASIPRLNKGVNSKC